ncbi:MAG: sigma-70 family RNA polymerase sigma factor, partial [Gemmatimonadota bacterium]
DLVLPLVDRLLQRVQVDGTFLRLLEHEVPEEGMQGWLFTVATNLVRDRSRTRERRRELLEAEDYGPDPPTRPDERVERSERVERVRRALDRLKPRDRRILLLREEGFQYSEIAEMIGVKASSVGTILARALDRFEDAYRELDDPVDREG